ncbi:MAG TPA: VOC family protein [Crenalkalicoccus sp.]|nr:VOC family protein [Crenalkalicoccus sp.]
MFSHVTVGSDDLARAIAFYDRVLAPLGLKRQDSDLEKGFAGYAAAPDTTPQFWVVRPLDGRAATVGNGVTIGFEAGDRATVDAVHAAALAAGARDEGAPGLRPHYHPHYYGAYVRDLDGHKLCCVCHRPVG